MLTPVLFALQLVLAAATFAAAFIAYRCATDAASSAAAAALTARRARTTRGRVERDQAAAPELYYCRHCGELIAENPPTYAYRFRHVDSARAGCGDSWPHMIAEPRMPGYGPELVDVAEADEPATAALAAVDDAPEPDQLDPFAKCPVCHHQGFMHAWRESLDAGNRVSCIGPACGCTRLQVTSDGPICRNCTEPVEKNPTAADNPLAWPWRHAGRLSVSCQGSIGTKLAEPLRSCSECGLIERPGEPPMIGAEPSADGPRFYCTDVGPCAERAAERYDDPRELLTAKASDSLGRLLDALGVAALEGRS